jgi:hypothetical protein
LSTQLGPIFTAFSIGSGLEGRPKVHSNRIELNRSAVPCPNLLG